MYRLGKCPGFVQSSQGAVTDFLLELSSGHCHKNFHSSQRIIRGFCSLGRQEIVRAL